MEPEIIQFICTQIAIVLGIIASFVLPYNRKKISGEIEELDPTYIYHLVITALWQFIVCFAVYSAWKPPTDVINSTLIIALAFLFGYGGSDMQKEVEKDIKQFFENRTTLEAKDLGIIDLDEIPPGTTLEEATKTIEINVTEVPHPHQDVVSEPVVPESE